MVCDDDDGGGGGVDDDGLTGRGTINYHHHATKRQGLVQ
jgi:hypothetical protein